MLAPWHRYPEVANIYRGFRWPAYDEVGQLATVPANEPDE
jgi:hypothetical protein